MTVLALPVEALRTISKQAERADLRKAPVHPSIGKSTLAFSSTERVWGKFVRVQAGGNAGIARDAFSLAVSLATPNPRPPWFQQQTDKCKGMVYAHSCAIWSTLALHLGDDEWLDGPGGIRRDVEVWLHLWEKCCA